MVKPEIPLLGLSFTDLDTSSAAALIAARPADAPFAYVVTPNADHLVRLSRDRDLFDIYRRGWMRLLDSRVVSMIGRLGGIPTPVSAPGSDLTRILLSEHVPAGERVVIIGLGARHVPVLTARLGLAPPLHHEPPLGFDRDPRAFAAAVSFVVDHPARLIFLAVGSPRQERLAAAIMATGRARGTGLCIGASLEFLAGVQTRAPVWMRHAGLEWLYRLAREPRRLARRYLIDSPKILPLLWRERRGAGVG